MKFPVTVTAFDRGEVGLSDTRYGRAEPDAAELSAGFPLSEGVSLDVFVPEKYRLVCPASCPP